MIRDVSAISDADLVERAVRNAHAGRRRSERWVHVMEAFALGSTFATQLCHRFGLDPDETVGEYTEPEDDE